MKRLLVFTIISIMIFSSFASSSMASSAGDDGSPPPAGGGGGGSGGPQFYDYYVPLVFDSSHPDGASEVVMWTLSQTVLITTFDQNEYGSNVAQLREPTKIVFNPDDNPGLTNGSLIRTTAPVQVVGQRSVEDITQDISFSYSILPRRMMGFEYYAPFDGTLSLVTLNAGTKVRAQSIDGSYTSDTFNGSSNAKTITVSKGDYVNTSYPTIGAFYSSSEGHSASMAVPRYLQGSLYYFDSDITAPREDEIDLSYISINPSEPTELTIFYSNKSNSQMNIFGPTMLDLDDNIRGLSSSRGSLEVNLRIKYGYGGTVRSSTIQLMAINEMRAAEYFLTPKDYSSHFSAGKELEFNFTRYSADDQSYIYSSRQPQEVSEQKTIQVVSKVDQQLIMASDYLFGMSVSPGKSSHPMAPSMAFVNIPFNSATQKNVTGLAGTWYRFANLAVTNVEIIPGPAEEYTGQLIRIEISSNGTLPASGFSVEVIIDEEVVIEESYDFLQVNDTIVYEIRKFLTLAKKKLNITVDVDTEDEVNEFNEDDNYLDVGFNVQLNIRLRGTILLIIVVLVVYSIVKFRKWLRNRRKVHRAHVDAIITFEEEE